MLLYSLLHHGLAQENTMLLATVVFFVTEIDLSRIDWW